MLNKCNFRLNTCIPTQGSRKECRRWTATLFNIHHAHTHTQLAYLLIVKLAHNHRQRCT